MTYFKMYSLPFYKSFLEIHKILVYKCGNIWYTIIIRNYTLWTFLKEGRTLYLV